MATPHNGIIKGNTVYNTILSLKLSYLHVLAHFIMWYTCISHKPRYFTLHVQFVFVNVYFKCTTQRFAQEGGFGQTHENLTATLGKLYQNFQILWVYLIPLPGSNH